MEQLSFLSEFNKFSIAEKILILEELYKENYTIEDYEVYEQCGVREYWIVDPKIRKIEVFENINNKFQLNNEARETGTVSSEVLEGFTVELEAIF
jgi:Uma2 family endonuclease